ncbi:glycoside hydrolase family 25 protein [Coleofasciculus sp. FACHB-SPT36]|uniref:glycoside hydrolase family 25 protein n=1 Tax=Cyanophyceae TaxID=3028117 RepID=UPI00168BC0B8|nr:glycoside hydrolase family 25 protein [Coleofasciculus sp. FACHB-SPT36]MBD2539415.1 glycoside hydrolase family 25 protein [Coleofasciculus sp. FACHB-SPT36]
MLLKINSPINSSQFQLGDAVSFQGNADSTVVRVEIFAEQYLLSTIPVINSSWSVLYPFNRAGKRRIIVNGFDAGNRQVASDAIDIWLLNSSSLGNSNASVLGIDVSNHNPPVNWQAVKNANISFALAKATEGATFKDKTFATNWSGMKAAGIMRGAYHFFRPQKTAEEQVDNFLQVVKNVLEAGDLPPVLDVEPWPEEVGEAWKNLAFAERINRVKIWLKKVEDATGEKPIIYTSPSFWREYMRDTQEFTDHPLWLAHYTSKPQPNVPANNWGGNGYTIWQHTESGTVAGVRGPVDRNRFNGSFDKLVALASGLVVA